MKKLCLIFTLALGVCMLPALHAHAQSTPADFYTGKWKITVMGTPNGDGNMFFIFEKKDGKLTGVINDSTDKEMTKITSVEVKDSTINAFFTTQGYDVNLFLQPTAPDSVKGNLMNMFDAKGYRIKEPKKQ